jgi:TonB family protein
MPDQKKYNYSAVDIEKYHKGLLSPKEMNELEKAALDDPFLADALEGYGIASANATNDISDLQKKLEERISGASVIPIATEKRSVQWWKIAAAIVIIGGLGFFTFKFFNKNDSSGSVAQLKKKETQPAPAPVIDSVKAEKQESTDVATSNLPVIQPSQRKFKSQLLRKKADTNSTASSIAGSDDVKVFHFQKQNLDTVTKDVALGSPTAKSFNSESVRTEGYAPMKKDMAALRKNEEKMNFFHGHVTDANNNPLPFANITNVRNGVGTYADANGNFTLISTDSVLSVRIRSVGFENDIAQLKNNVTLNKIILQEDKTAPDRIISYQQPDTSRTRGSMKFEEPEPVDGWINYNAYLVNNIEMPDNPAKGQVELSFDVDQDGNPVNIKVEKSLCQKCDEEATRLVKQGPKWKKKSKNSKRVTVTVPFDSSR